jgi:UDP-N-acetylglucosamine--N-acetylmuramyl-(pentapeptide) pyrophosphoryl-undecaprenol N-acetylglucosamine transferase
MPATTPVAWQRGTRQLVVTGYPVRADIMHADRTTTAAMLGIHDQTPLILVYGGSRGARTINHGHAALLTHVLPLAHVLHVCGREGDEAMLQTHMVGLPVELQHRYHLYPDLATDGALTMTAALAAADVTICRSGASVLGELPAAGLPAILVPIPTSTKTKTPIIWCVMVPPSKLPMAPNQNYCGRR